MAISPICDKCKNELERPGGLAFSPPDPLNLVGKVHLCQKCWVAFCRWLAEH